MEDIESGRPTLSACMIVKNEEKFLPQCLESIKAAVDEIIVVDTGSMDRTVEIAESYGARVFHHLWKNNFSEARNYSLQQATGDWILVIDADERLEKRDIPILRAVLRRKEYNSIIFAVLSELPTGISMNHSQRVFRRGSGHYEGIVHNQLICEGDVLITGIRLYHYGYNLSDAQMREKYKRTENLLKQQLAENPKNAFAWMNLTRIYKCQELWEDAINAAEEVLKLDPNPDAYQMVMYDMAYSAFKMGNYEKSEKACAELLKAYPENLDGTFLLGSVNVCKEDYQKAIRYYMRYIELSEQRRSYKYTNLIVDTYGSQAQAWNNIGSCYINLGQADRAVIAYQKAIAHNNRDPVYYENLAHVFLSQNRLDKAIKLLEEAVNLDIATGHIYYQMGEIYRSQRRINLAIDHFRKALQMDSSNVRCYADLGGLLIIQGRLEEAKAILNEAFALQPEHPAVLHNLAIVSMRLQKKENCAKYINKVMELKGISAGQYMSMGDDWAVMKEYETAIPFYERCLQSDPDNSTALINLATCYAELGRYESAFIGYRAALAKKPNDPTIIRNLLTMKEAITRSIT